MTTTSLDPTVRPDWQPPRDTDQARLPWRYGIATALGVLLWLGAYLALVGVLVPARIAEISPDNKATALATMSTVAMIVSTIANILWGALSDRTRSRFGRRTPWLIAGSIGSCASILVWSQVDTIALIITMAAVFQIFLNMIVAPLLVVLSDRVAPKFRGTMSAVYGFGYTIGLYGGQVVASQFIDVPKTGFLVMAVATLLAGPVAALILREKSSKDMPVDRLTWAMFSDTFAFPTHNARDYYLALFGKLLMIAAKFMISGYMLYIVTDYLLLEGDAVSGKIAQVNLILMVTALLFGVVAGPLSDRLKRRKLPVVVAGLFIAVGTFIPFLSNEPWTLVAFALVAGVGMGSFTSVDQALNLEVLPDPQRAAKDLGVLNLANNGGQVIGPVLAAAVVSMGGYHLVFLTSAIVAVLGTVLIALIRRR